MLKKLLTLAFVASLGLGMLAGCKKEEPKAPDTDAAKKAVQDGADAAKKAGEDAAKAAEDAAKKATD